jgi:predicted outer membrane repeat protein
MSKMLVRAFFLVAVGLVLVFPSLAGELVRVPAEAANLESAIGQVTDGGVIEMAHGTYLTPAGGWFFSNLQKSFTIRAESGATVTLSGDNNRPVFRVQNTSSSLGGQIAFENLIFSNGHSTQDGVGGGVTIEANPALFTDCVFQDNYSDANQTGGGGAFVFGGAAVQFIRCQFLDNRATNEGGGLKIGEGSKVVVHQSIFSNNRVNLAGHRPSSAGGGIHVGNADLIATNSRFVGNEAGFVGGGIYSIGLWQNPVTTPRSIIDIANCTFEDNKAEPFPGVSPPTMTEGGAVHAENQVFARIDNSRFLENSADTGGGVNLYRARIAVANSVFRGNRATAVGAGAGFGGALSAISNDTAADGSNNRPSANLTVTDTLVQGSYQTVGSVGQIGGGIYSSGDGNRQYGRNGVPAIPNLAANRSSVTISGGVFTDCQVIQSPNSSGVGGGAMFDLVGVDVDDTLFLNSEAVGTNSHGGAFRTIGQSLVYVDGATFAGNEAERFGGAIYAQGVEAHFDNCALIENTNGGSLYGAAFFGAPDESTGISLTGSMTGSVISNTADRGLLIFDDDRQGAVSTPYNDLRYNGNVIFDQATGMQVYQDSITGRSTAAQLNSLVVNRTGGTPSTDKSQTNNSNPSSAPVVASIAAAPKVILAEGAAGDPIGATAAFVGFAWTGGSATLNGSPVTGFTGLSQVSVGTQTLNVNGVQDSVFVNAGATPAATLAAVPVAISSGEQAQLQWATPAGTFVDVVLDHAVTVNPGSTGTVMVSPMVTTTYHLFVLTEEGGATAQATVWVNDFPGLIFMDGFESGNTNAWN